MDLHEGVPLRGSLQADRRLTTRHENSALMNPLRYKAVEQKTLSSP
jgi:hypothetical protein